MHERKLKVVALCGGHSCTETLKFQCTRLRTAIGKDLADWVYLEGDVEWHWNPQEPDLSPAEEKLAGGRQLKNWCCTQFFLSHCFGMESNLSSEA
eukprot:4014271-Amphidinium_carterae.1